MHSHIDSLLACGHELNYDTTVRELEKALRKLNDELLRQGWAVMPSSSTAAAALAVHPGQRLGKAGALPCRDAAGVCHRSKLLVFGVICTCCSQLSVIKCWCCYHSLCSAAVCELYSCVLWHSVLLKAIASLQCVLACFCREPASCGVV